MATTMSATMKRRPLGLTIVLVILGLGFAKAVITAIWFRDEYGAVFPGATPVLFGLQMLGLLGLILAWGGMWMWQRWSLPLLIADSALVVVLDVLTRAPLVHLISGPVFIALTIAFAWPVRWRLGLGAPPPGA